MFLFGEGTLQDAIEELNRMNINRAESILIQLLSKDITDPVVNHTYGVLLGNTGRWEEAVIYLRRAFENSSDDAVACTYALALEKTGNYLEAKSIWKKLVKCKNQEIKKIAESHLKALEY